ncbi:MAG TPA: hypothetical protein VEH77_14295 [Roseiarcus sp.]|nr:hypothetical protein [Roseiarcus sp.]
MRIPAMKSLAAILSAAVLTVTIGVTEAGAAVPWLNRHGGHASMMRAPMARGGHWGDPRGGFAFGGRRGGSGFVPFGLGLLGGFALGNAYAYPYGYDSPCWVWRPIVNAYGHVIGHRWVYVCG